MDVFIPAVDIWRFGDRRDGKSSSRAASARSLQVFVMDGEKTCRKWGDVYQSYPLRAEMRLAEPSFIVKKV